MKLQDVNWGPFLELEGRLEKMGISIERTSVEISRYPDTITYNSFEEAFNDIKENGNPKRFYIVLSGTINKKSFNLRLVRLINLRDQYIFKIEVEDIKSTDIVDSITDYLGLEPGDEFCAQSNLERTAFIAHRFDSAGTELADKLARFLELLGIKVSSGRSFSPGPVSSKVKSRIKSQALFFLIISPGEDNTWLTQESILGIFQDKPLFRLREESAKLKTGILTDYEYIPFESLNIQNTFIPILEGLRELKYLYFE